MYLLSFVVKPEVFKRSSYLWGPHDTPQDKKYIEKPLVLQQKIRNTLKNRRFYNVFLIFCCKTNGFSMYFLSVGVWYFSYSGLVFLIFWLGISYLLAWYFLSSG